MDFMHMVRYLLVVPTGCFFVFSPPLHFCCCSSSGACWPFHPRWMPGVYEWRFVFWIEFWGAWLLSMGWDETNTLPSQDANMSVFGKC